MRLNPERVLVIGDARRDVTAALAEALPSAQVTAVPTLFDGIAELSGNRFSTVLASAEPMERRPEPAVRTLREIAGDARLVLFGHPTLEILSRKMMEFGCDDYVVTPASATEFRQILGNPPMRIARPDESADAADAPPSDGEAKLSLIAKLRGLPIADIVLDAMMQHPADAVRAAIKAVQSRVSPELELGYAKPGQPAPEAPEGRAIYSHPIEAADNSPASLQLSIPIEEDAGAAQRALGEIARILGKVAALQERHNRLQRLAITDELTGLYNARYFRHFLSSILERAKAMHFPVTLLLFDIDDFKHYNDQFGHGTGDEILKQVSALMRRCTRQHDLVARIGGDEFAVVFWDKEGPRQPRTPKPQPAPPGPSRPPHEPIQVFERFRGLIASEEFPLLGQSGKGKLTVSAGLAVFPWDATTIDGLIAEADCRLMQGAKKRGKDSLYIVGDDNLM